MDDKNTDQVCRNKETALIHIDDATKIFAGIYNIRISLKKFKWKFGDLGDDRNQRALIFLCSLIKALNMKTVFEFGTFRGKTTYNLAINLPEDGVIHTIDIGYDIDKSNIENKGYGSYIVGEVFASSPEHINTKITQYLSDTRSFNYDRFENNIDLVFVDGSHEYDAVLSDSRNALRIVKRGGVIVWDDYDSYWPGVKKAIDELSREYPLYFSQKEKVVFFIKK